MQRADVLRSLGAGADLGLTETERIAVLAMRGPPRETVAWETLAAASPVAQLNEAQMAPDRLDDAIGRYLPHLREVCRSPHASLDLVVEPTLAARARRLAPNAVEHLAEHSGDWYRRSVSGVIPRRLLAQRIEPALDVYENRVAASLIDQLRRRLLLRLANIRQIEELLKDALDSHDLSGTQHRLAWRLAEMWGSTVATRDHFDRITELHADTLKRLRVLGGLIDSVLYRGLPPRARTKGSLRTTNVLTDHQHYRRVAALWMTLQRDRQKQALNAEEREELRRQLIEAYDTYCLILLARAFEGLGLAAPPDTAIVVGRPWEVELTGLPVPVALGWDPATGATIRVDGRPVARLVPLAVALSASDHGDPAPSQVGERLDRLAALATPGDDVPVVVLYPGQRSERLSLPPALQRRLNAPEAGLPGPQPASVPISPVDLFSLERVERVVRRAVTIAAFDRFPPAVACLRNVRESVLGAADWLADTGDLDTVAVLQPPDEQRLHQLERGFRDAIAHVTRADARKKRTEAFDAFVAEVHTTRPLFDQLRRCPACGTGGARLTLLDGGTRPHFRARCTACTASWGTHACANGHRIPFLDLGGQISQAPGPDGLDRAYGRDVLAVPCTAPGATHVFVCPTCHACPSSAEECGPHCLRAA